MGIAVAIRSIRGRPLSRDGFAPMAGVGFRSDAGGEDFRDAPSPAGRRPKRFPGWNMVRRHVPFPSPKMSGADLWLDKSGATGKSGSDEWIDMGARRMLVHQILQSKPEGGVIFIEPESSVNAAVELLSGKRIGAVIVSSDGTVPLGILSERDIVRELGQRGTVCLQEAVETLMTKDLVGCGRDDTADDVLSVMTKGRFRHMPVMQGGEMVGLISIGDVVKARLSELSMETEALQGMIMGY